MQQKKDGLTMYVVYGRDNCPACVAAKQLLERKNLPFAFMDVTKPEIKQQLLEQKPDTTTVPQIWNGSKYVGGFDELNASLTISLGESKVQLNG